MRIKLVAINCRYTHSCLALFYVRNELAARIADPDIEIKQFAISDPYFATLLQLTDRAVEAIFFSVYIWNAVYVNRLVADLTRIRPEALIVLGGPQVTYLPLADLPDNCTVVRGEVEGLSAVFYEDLARGVLQREYRTESGRPFSFPYQDVDFDHALKDRQIYFESSRGCPFACSYCLSSVEQGVRYKPLDQVRVELEKILAFQPEMVRFIDRTFNSSYERTLAIWQFLADKAAGTQFHFEIAPDRFNETLFDFLEHTPPGLFQFEIGLQSTNPPTLAAINRQTDLTRARANIVRLVRLDTIHIHVDLILGLPHETRDSFRTSFNEVFNLFPHHLQMGLLKILPGTALANALEYGIIASATPPYEVLATRWLDHDSLRHLYWLGECVESFYNTRFFRTIMNYFRQHEDDPFAVFEQLLALCWERNFFARARTPESMFHILYEFVAKRPDAKLLHELLVFDWVRSGHRSAPQEITAGGYFSDRRRLQKELPQNLAPYYAYSTRDDFIRHNFFAGFSWEALLAAGIDAKGPATVCFLQEKTGGVYAYKKVLLLDRL